MYYGLDVSVFITARQSILQQGSLIAFIEILLTILLLSLIGYYLTQHLDELLTGIKKVTQGQYDTDIPIASDDEVGQLATGYNLMAQAVRDRINALQDEKNRLQITFESITDAVITTNAAGEIDYINPVAATLTSWSDSECAGLALSAVYKIHHQDSGKIIEQPVAGCLLNSLVVHSGSNTILTTRHDAELFVEDTAAPLRDHNKNIIGAILVFRDISQRIAWKEELLQHRNHLENLVSRRTQELESINQELESFSYSVSHNLRAPLRRINGFSHALEEDCAGQINDQGKDHLQRIRNAAQRMDALINDLVMLSSTTRLVLKPALLNISDIAKKIAHQLHASQPDRKVEIQIQPQLEAFTDPGLLEIVLENLLGNVWKYTGNQENPLIEIGQKWVKGEHIIYIRDNGTGFDMLYADKLFGAFQRLQGADEFTGTGIGLATVKRIIHRHGGRIWAEATVTQLPPTKVGGLAHSVLMTKVINRAPS